MTHINLKEARARSKLTAATVAEKIGISRSQLYRIESGESQAAWSIARAIRKMWPRSKVPDLAIYDPVVFEERRDKKS